MHLASLDQLLWALSFLGHCLLLAILVIRDRVVVFRAFTTLILTNIVRTIVLFFTLRFGSTEFYFYTYWAFAVVDVVLQLAVAYELATKVFRPLGVWAPDVRRSFLVIIVGCLLVAASMTWLASPPTRTLRLAIIIRADFFASALIGELFVAMIALSVTLGLPWRTHVARLAQGLGTYSIFGILTDAAHSYFGSASSAYTYRFLSRLQIVLYLSCLAYWSVTLALKEPEPRKMPEQLQDELRRFADKGRPHAQKPPNPRDCVMRELIFLVIVGVFLTTLLGIAGVLHPSRAQALSERLVASPGAASTLRPRQTCRRRSRPAR